MNRHQVPAAMFASMAAGNSGPDAVAWLAAAEYSRRLLFVRGVLIAARESAHSQYGWTRDAYDLLADIQHYAAEEVDAVLRYPPVGAWVGRTLLAQGIGQPSEHELSGGSTERTGAAVPAGLATVAGSAAIRSRFPCSIPVPVTEGVITFPSVGQAALPVREGEALLRCGADGAELVAGRFRLRIPDDTRTDVPGWRGLRQISAGPPGAALRLVIDDLDPYRMWAPALATRLTRAEVSRWESALGAAWKVLCAYHQAAAAEIAAATRVLVPLRPIDHGVRSVTSREHFGSVGISEPPDTVSLALALAHEVQHTKLYALQNLTRLTRPDDGQRYYAPWRDDPRPASGLLQGAYAYLGVSRFWRRQRHVAEGTAALVAHAEFARWRSAVVSVTDGLLDSGRLTGDGHVLVSGMAAAARSWEEEPVPAEAESAARRAAARHAAHWRVRNCPHR
ncbi:MAG TPA: HEXXH motif domain-containing protein [Trebonia sp.]